MFITRNFELLALIPLSMFFFIYLKIDLEMQIFFEKLEKIWTAVEFKVK